MRCFICDAALETPQFNRDHGDYDPCVTCLEIIGEVFSDEPTDLDDKAEAGEDITEEELDKLIAAFEKLKL